MVVEKGKLMRVYEQIPVHCIQVKGKLPITPKAMEFAEALKRGAKFPPVRVETIGKGGFILLDGRNRLSAHKLAGKDTIFAAVSRPDGLPTDPTGDRPLATNGKSGFEPKDSIPQADGYSLHDGESWKE